MCCCSTQAGEGKLLVVTWVSASDAMLGAPLWMGGDFKGVSKLQCVLSLFEPEPEPDVGVGRCSIPIHAISKIAISIASPCRPEAGQ